MIDYFEYSTPELVHLLGQRFKDYRMRCELTQGDVAEQTGVSVNTVHRFENGKATNITLGTFLLLLRAVGVLGHLDALLPELPESAYLVNDGRKTQRIRHRKPC